MRSALFFLLICHLSISPSWVSAQTSKTLNVESDVLGPVYPIVEPNLLTMLKKHAQEATTNTQSRLHEVRQQLQNWSNHPIGQALPVAHQYIRKHYPINESVKHYLPEDYRRDWFFIDTQDPMQLKLAKHFLQNCPRTDRCRIVVVHGELKATRERLKTPLWFDQGGKLTKQLHITHIPTLVTLTREAVVTHAAPVKNFPLEEALSS